MSDARMVEPADVVEANSKPDKMSFVSGLAATFRKRVAAEGDDFVLDVALHAAAGFNILFGASGAGKTTLLDCVAGLAVPDEGTISVGSRTFFDRAGRIN